MRAPFSLVTSAAVNSLPGLSRSVTGLLSPDFSVKAPAPGLSNTALQPALVRNAGSTACTTVLASSRCGFLIRILAPSSVATRPLSPPPPATGNMLRQPMLLSFGTSRHSGIDSPAAMLLTLLWSPAADATMNRHSCPSTVGVHSNGPTVMTPPLFAGTFGALSCVVVIGCQSLG